jgi:transposase
VQEYLKEIQDIALEKIVYIDETGVDKNCYKQRGWGKIGEILLGKVIGKYVKRTNVVAGLCDKKVIAPMIFHGSCNSEFFVKWVKEQLVPSLTVGQIVVMDNASFHKSPLVQEAIEKANCKLIYLPPYSPEHNPIEKFWANMKRWIQNNIPNITDSWNALQQFFANSIST